MAGPCSRRLGNPVRNSSPTAIDRVVRLNHDGFGLTQSKAINVIDLLALEPVAADNRSALGPALGGVDIPAMHVDRVRNQSKPLAGKGLLFAGHRFEALGHPLVADGRRLGRALR